MKFDWKTFGHSGIKAILEKQLASGTLPHAFLFSGAEGVGKKTLALELAGKILETENLQTHPDFQIFEQPGQISVESIRDFITNLSFKPFIGKKKVAIINDAQNLNIQSSNALLKTLEEPSPSTIIILISNTNNLLPTIVSRCQTFVVNEFSLNMLKDFATQQQLKVSDEIINLSFGSIARLKNLVSSKEALETELDFVAEFKKIKQGLPGERLLAVDEFGLLETEQLQQKFTTWLLWAVSELKNYPKSFKSVSAITNALEGLKINKNKKLVLQGLFLNI